MTGKMGTKKSITQKGGANTLASTIKKYIFYILALFVMLPVLSKTLEDVAPNKLKALRTMIILLGILILFMFVVGLLGLAKA